MRYIVESNRKASLVVLYLQNYHAAGICGYYHESLDRFEYPKKSLDKSPMPPPPKKKKNHKIPIISPGLIFVQQAFAWFIFGGA